LICRGPLREPFTATTSRNCLLALTRVLQRSWSFNPLQPWQLRLYPTYCPSEEAEAVGAAAEDEVAITARGQMQRLTMLPFKQPIPTPRCRDSVPLSWDTSMTLLHNSSCLLMRSLQDAYPSSTEVSLRICVYEDEPSTELSNRYICKDLCPG
jgi:hypothetical protein